MNSYVKYYNKPITGIIKRYGDPKRFNNAVICDPILSYDRRTLSEECALNWCINSPNRLTSIIRNTEKNVKIYAEAVYKTYPTNVAVR